MLSPEDAAVLRASAASQTERVPERSIPYPNIGKSADTSGGPSRLDADLFVEGKRP